MNLPLNSYGDVLAYDLEVCELCPGAQVDVVSKDAVSDVGEVARLWSRLPARWKRPYKECGRRREHRTTTYWNLT
ncbi:MAG: hypothetical protein COX16_04390 [Deltaproteobacteria bacterium CG23_combo_of_CG06-09_8_20_14_all_51_20]|nr:hypothetical protein [bacterium]NCP07902.1 hypothetical protein [bacterium]PIP47431.1 MAG: hypothetical protein COX16_04390 [Deltaproteobacteria bacterium CG23_combo_of_CG06-09_8_20_14_all_51_20]PIY25809.1 MAG: hypothetical protein COZ11_04320 [Deltaproteobacteria bacterium CG_4_10_14_3_um_filter_51_14]PJB35360.1 MAG: hypothetical protein CO107_10745 [Deltaproteobacteria bacterium CG_4_9_14_3_um_filter_51_14]